MQYIDFVILLFQLLSLEDVERIMDETQEGIEKQRVSDNLAMLAFILI